jgi:hypothetical protein
MSSLVDDDKDDDDDDDGRRIPNSAAARRTSLTAFAARNKALLGTHLVVKYHQEMEYNM